MHVFLGVVNTRAQSSTVEWTSYPEDSTYLTPGEWHHIAISYSKKGHLAVFVDGLQRAEHDTSSGGLDSSSDFKTGKTQTPCCRLVLSCNQGALGCEPIQRHVHTRPLITVAMACNAPTCIATQATGVDS